MENAAPRPAPLAVPAQLFDDSPAAAEVVMPLKGRRVGVYRQLFEDASPEVVAACRHAIDLMREHGCEVQTAVIFPSERIQFCTMSLMERVMSRFHNGVLEENSLLFLLGAHSLHAHPWASVVPAKNCSRRS